MPINIVIGSDKEAVSERPLDWSLAYFRSHKWNLLVFGFLYIAFRVVIEVVALQGEFSKSKWFWASMARIMLETWFFGVIAMRVISALRLENPSARDLCLRSLRAIPKVFFSFLSMLFFIVFIAQGLLSGFSSAAVSSGGLPLVPLFVLITFPLLFWSMFFWSPLFVVGETYAPPTKKIVADDDFVDDDDLPVRKVTYFKDKGAWELGYMRSSWFTFLRPKLTAQVLLMLWIAVIVPKSVTSIFFGTHGPLSDYCDLFLTTLSNLWFYTVFAGSFYSALPISVLKEIEIDWAKVAFGVENKRKVSIESSRLKIGALCIIAALCSVIVVNKSIEEQHIPVSAEFRYLGVERQGEDLVFKIALISSDGGFEWLVDQTRFVASSVSRAEEFVDLISARAEQSNAQTAEVSSEGNPSLSRESISSFSTDNPMAAQQTLLSLRSTEGSDTLAGQSRSNAVVIRSGGGAVQNSSGEEFMGYYGGALADEELVLFLRFKASAIDTYLKNSTSGDLYIYHVTPFQVKGPLIQVPRSGIPASSAQ